MAILKKSVALYETIKLKERFPEEDIILKIAGKIIILLLFSCIFTAEVDASTIKHATTLRSTRVKGYIRHKDRRLVSNHYKSRSDRSRVNNWSSKGRVNPYTDAKGHKNPIHVKTRRAHE